jgi:hypothetical protein
MPSFVKALMNRGRKKETVVQEKCYGKAGGGKGRFALRGGDILSSIKTDLVRTPADIERKRHKTIHGSLRAHTLPFLGGEIPRGITINTDT